ncbi:MAG: hypothetical protein R3C26_20275 [Calditrichia bacterium]
MVPIFPNAPHGYDILHHGLGHEWWGNLVTALAGSGCTKACAATCIRCMLSICAGIEAYHNTMGGLPRIAIVRPSRRGMPKQLKKCIFCRRIIWNQADIFNKGVWVLHSLRYLMGDEAFLKHCGEWHILIRDGKNHRRQPVRFFLTDDFVQICEDIYGSELDCFRGFTSGNRICRN